MLSIHKKVSSYDAIFFSPHLDDAVLSASLQMMQLVKQRKKVLLVTFFTNGQLVTSRDSALFLSTGQHHSALSLFAARKKEDVVAAKKLKIDTLHLDLVDALFRTNDRHHLLYETFSQVFSGRINPQDHILIKQLQLLTTDIVQTYAKPTTLFFAPLGVGDHVDHLLIFKVSMAVIKKKLVFWEDVPYQIHAEKVIKRLSNLFSEYGQSYEHHELFKPGWAEQKKQAISCYRSQVNGLNEAGLSTLQYQLERWYTLKK